MINWPQKLFGIGKPETWLNRLLTSCRMLHPVETPDIRPEFTVNGVGYFIKDRAGGGGGGGPAVKRFQVIEVLDDTLRCGILSDDTQSIVGQETVAKPFALRGVGSSESYGNINGTPVAPDTIGLAPSKQRRVFQLDQGDNTEVRVFQSVTPSYAAGEIPVGSYSIIQAIQVNDTITGVDGVNWLDLNIDARHWETEHDYATVCVNGEEKKIYLPRSETQQDS